MSRRPPRPHVFTSALRVLGVGLFAGLALVTPAAAGKRPIHRGFTDLVRLSAPAPGATLIAGTRVAVFWSPGDELATFPSAEEWELFVSLDGGRTWLARLTPHLDLEHRAVSVRLPELASDDARFMVRVGDERVEREQPLPGRYRILPPALQIARGPRLAVARRGEPARPRTPGVVAWVEGARDGRGWVQRHGGAASGSVGAAVAPAGLVLLVVAPTPDPAPAHRRARPAVGHRVPQPTARLTVVTAGPSTDPSLPRLCRWNV
jgi:hypothetical protein